MFGAVRQPERSEISYFGLCASQQCHFTRVTQPKPLVIPAHAGIQHGLNWTPALPYPGSTGAWRHACAAGVTLGRVSYFTVRHAICRRGIPTLAPTAWAQCGVPALLIMTVKMQAHCIMHFFQEAGTCALKSIETGCT